jgi:hypothetical protein
MQYRKHQERMKKKTECKIAGEQEKVRVAMFSLIISVLIYISKKPAT